MCICFLIKLGSCLSLNKNHLFSVKELCQFTWGKVFHRGLYTEQSLSKTIILTSFWSFSCGLRYKRESSECDMELFSLSTTLDLVASKRVLCSWSNMSISNTFLSQKQIMKWTQQNKTIRKPFHEESEFQRECASVLKILISYNKVLFNLISPLKVYAKVWFQNVIRTLQYHILYSLLFFVLLLSVDENILFIPVLNVVNVYFPIQGVPNHPVGFLK